MGCDYLIHHGVKGQRWGVRRYQTHDGKLTRLGKIKQQKYAKYLLKTSINDDKTQYKIVNKRVRRASRKNDSVLFDEYTKLGKDYYDRISRNKDYLSKIKDGSVEAGKDYVATKTHSLTFSKIHGIGYKTTFTLRTNTGIELNKNRVIY